MMYTLEELKRKNFAELKKIGYELNVLPEGDRRCRQTWIDAIAGVNPPLLQLLEVSPAASAVEQVQPIIETLETPSAVEVEPVQMLPIESKFGRIVYPQPAQKPIVQSVENFPGVDPGVDVDRALEPIAQVAKNSPGVEVDSVEESIVPAKNFPGSRSKASIAHQLLELFQSTAHIIEDSPGVKTEATVSESAIAPAAKNPILIGVTFSDRFLARYSPPQVQIIHFQSDADGQLSLLDFEVQSVDEPPDPDDSESLDAFCEAISRWDWEHPTSSFDHFSDLLPSSVQNEPSSVQNEPSSVQNELPLQISLDSFCLWAHCPDDWYEPAVLLEPPPAHKSSITSDFFIPTFGSLGDGFNGSDEPPDTGIFARPPKPKPPKFPSQAASQQLVDQASRNYPETIPKLFHRVAAGSSTQPARSPPGGDA